MYNIYIISYINYDGLILHEVKNTDVSPKAPFDQPPFFFFQVTVRRSFPLNHLKYNFSGKVLHFPEIITFKYVKNKSYSAIKNHHV